MAHPPHSTSQMNLTASYYPGQDDDFQIPVVSPVPQRNNPEMSDHITQNLAHLELEARSSSPVSDMPSPIQQQFNGYPPKSHQQTPPQQQHPQSYTQQQQSYPQQQQQGYQQRPQVQQQQQGYHPQSPPQQQETYVQQSQQRQGTYPQQPQQPGGYSRQSQQPQQPQQPQAPYGSRQSSVVETGPAPVQEDEPSFTPFPVVRNRKLNVPPSDEEKEEILESARNAVLNSNDPEMQLAWAQDTLAYVEIAQQNELRLAEFRLARPGTPKIERRLRVDAVNVVEFLAQQHHPKAEFIRGTWLEFGRFGFEMDKREAFRCYSRSAQNGYVRAEYRMGMQFESSNEIDKAVRHYSLGVQARDPASSYRMGMMSLLGQHGQAQDFARGLDLIRFSADNADENAPQGAYVYGMLHVRELAQIQVPEHALPYDVDLARLNIEKAAYLGFSKAQVKMGAAYELSELNCEFDPVLSLHYNNLAARQGEADAEMSISKWFLSGYEGIFAKNEAMAFAYAQRAAATGLATAEFAMGYFYEVGIHVHTSIKEARSWYSKAADHGNKDAQGRLEGISRSKTLSRKDHDKIAMARIKSTRGTRPPRNQQNQPPQQQQPPVSMPHIPETYGQSYAPPTAPPAGPDTYNQRPQSGRPPYGQGSVPQPQMPQSARPPYGPQGLPPNPAYGAGQYDRTYSNLAPQPYGRPAPPPKSSSPLPPQSQPVGPGPGYGPQYPQSGPRPGPNMPNQQQAIPLGPPQNRIPSGGPPPRTAASPLPDIGYNAPPDYGRRLPQASPANRPPPGVGRPGVGIPSSTQSPRPALAQGTAPGRLPQPPKPASTQFSTLTPPVSTNPTKVPANGASAGSKLKPPGKGPSTFDEMGVPQQKKKDDCIVM